MYVEYLVALVGTEESCVMSLLNDDERDSRLISNLQLHTSLADRSQLVGQHGGKLSFTHTVAVVDDACRLEVSRSVELHQKVTHHARQLLDHLLTMRLQANGCRVAAGMSVHAADNLTAHRGIFHDYLQHQ